jgi:plasmid maintenance system antidote protein VapI
MLGVLLMLSFAATALPISEADVGQREVLRHIQEHPFGTTVAEMAEHFGATTSTIVGIINGGIQRNIESRLRQRG